MKDKSTDYFLHCHYLSSLYRTLTFGRRKWSAWNYAASNCCNWRTPKHSLFLANQASVIWLHTLATSQPRSSLENKIHTENEGIKQCPGVSWQPVLTLQKFTVWLFVPLILISPKGGGAAQLIGVNKLYLYTLLCHHVEHCVQITFPRFWLTITVLLFKSE